MADGNMVEVEGVGSFSLELPGGFQLNLDDVLYVPSLKKKRPDPKIKAKPCIIYRIKSPAQYMLHQVESRVIQSFI